MKKGEGLRKKRQTEQEGEKCDIDCNTGPHPNTPHISGQGQHSMGPLSALFVNWQMLLDECVKEEKTKRVGLSIRRVLAFIAASSQLCPTFVLQSIHLPDKQHVFLHCPFSLLLNCCSPFPCSVFMHHHCNFYVSKISTSLLDIWLLCSSTLPVIQNPEIHIRKLHNGTPHPYDFSLLSY